MLGFIKNLAKKADNSFYLELKDGEEVKSSESKQPEVPATVSEAVTTVKEKISQIADATSDTAATVKKEVAKAAKSTKAEAAKAAKSAKVEAAKSAKAQKEADAAQKAAMAAKKQELPVEKNFATKYLISSGSSERRRPGANMNAFLEMAKGVKAPTQK